MKKVLLFCMSVVFMTSTVFSQSLNLDENHVQKSKFSKELTQKSLQTWDIQLADTLDDICTNPVGAVSDGMYLYAGCLNNKRIYKIDDANDIIDTISISNIPDPTKINNVNMMGLAYDGNYFYVTNGNDSIYCIDLAAQQVISAITLPDGILPLGVTYASHADGGNGGFWVSTILDNSLKLFSMNGDLLDSITYEDSNYYYGSEFIVALAYDEISMGGPFLYALENTSKNIFCINLSTKGINAQVHSVSEDMPDWASKTSYSIYIKPNTSTLGVLFTSKERIEYDLTKLALPRGLTIVHTYTKPWLSIGEDGKVSANIYTSSKAPVTSFTFNYKFDGTTYNQTFTDFEISNGYYNLVTIEHETIIPALTAEGSHDLEIWLSDINGSHTSNTIEMTVDVYQKVVQRIVLHEAFVSSTSAACVIPNQLLDTIFQYNPDKFTCIKYQMNAPAFDPYYTVEGEARKNYYEVGLIPFVAVDGNYFADYLGSYTPAVFQLGYILPSFVELDATFTYDDTKTYAASITVNPLKSITGNNKLYAAVVEKVTRMNMKTNGERAFYYVMKKFLTDVDGDPIDLVEDKEVNVDLSFQFKGNFRLPFSGSNMINNDIEHSVENFKNLMLVYWIQNDDTKEVLQSGKVEEATLSIGDFAEMGTVKVYPNPSEGMINIESENEFSNVKILNMLGQVVYNSHVKTHNYSVGTSQLVSGLYILQLQTENGVINRKISVK